MARKRLHLIIGLAACLTVACTNDRTPNDDPDSGEQDISVALMDSSTDLGTVDGTATDAELPPNDTGGAPDAAFDATVPPPDLGPAGEITNCAEACARVSACNRQDLFGGEGACLIACEHASREAPPAVWFDCLEIEECNLLHLCRLPDPPSLTCQQVCDSIEACEIDFPAADCLDECTARNDNGSFSACGELVFGGLCNENGFWECLGRDVYSDCQERCRVGLECNLVREAECLPDCIGELSSADPLTRHRGEDRNLCVRFAAEDCATADQCFNPNGGQVVIADQATFCRLWDGCFAGFIPCNDIWPFVSMQPGSAECAVRLLQRGCPPDPEPLFNECFEGGGGGGGGIIDACGSLCEALEICDDLPEGQARQDCIGSCLDDFESGDEATAEFQRSRTACGLANSCPELGDCLSATEPEEACPRHCAALDNCGLPSDDCAERCDREFRRPRHTQWRGCVTEAVDDCAAVAACAPPAVVGCAEVCARRTGCGFENDDCLEECDNFQFADFDRATSLFACVLAAATCEDGPLSMMQCFEDDFLPDGHWKRCLGYCRSQHGCGTDNGQAIVDCLEACGAGFIGQPSHVFAEGDHCALQAAACEGAQECFPDEAPERCGAWCAGLTECDAAPATCANECDPLAQRRSHEQANCRQEADLRPPAEQCEAVLSCMPPVVRNAAEIQGIELLEACQAVCVAKLECGVAEGDLRTCVGGCYESATSDAPEVSQRERQQLACGASPSCGDLTTCIGVNSPVSACRNHCERIAGCGGNAEGCEATCDALFFRARHQAYRQCVAIAAPYDAEQEDWDCAAAAQCVLADTLDCEAQCARLETCGSGSADCAQRCDNENFESLEAAIQRFSCVMSAPRCGAFGSGSVGACRDNPNASGEACRVACVRENSCENENLSALSGCLALCGRDRSDALNVTAESIEECLGAREEPLDEAGCQTLAECSASPLGVDCAGHCGALNACGDMPEDCIADCSDGGAAMLRALEMDDCIADAEGNCDAIEECAAVDEEPVPVDQAEVCNQYNACGLNLGLGIECQQIMAIVNPNQAQLRCLLDELTPCPDPDNPAGPLDRCLGGAPGAGPNHIGNCRAYCASHQLCGIDDMGARDCWGDCYTGLTRNPRHPYAARVACRGALSCGALRTCINPDGGEPCAAVCATATDCGAFDSLEACTRLCNTNRFLPFARQGYLDDVTECLDGLQEAECRENGQACFELAEPVLATCEDACERMTACEDGDLGACIQGCTGAQREDPVGNQVVIDCVVQSIEPPERCDFEAVDRCIEDALGNGPGGRDLPVPPPE